MCKLTFAAGITGSRKKIQEVENSRTTEKKQKTWQELIDGVRRNQELDVHRWNRPGSVKPLRR